MALQIVTSLSEFEHVVEQNPRILLLKNSTTCPISHEAFRQYEKLANELEGEYLYFLNVQEARDLSNEIASKYSVKHESPQVLLFENGQVQWHASHWKITYKVLKEIY